MTALRHIFTQPFVTATGLAALLHSTWALGTLFAGEQPDVSDVWAFAGWLIPALLIAFAMDIGQIMTSVHIRERGLSFSRGATFVVFAIATYYLQWLYIVHHIPALDLSAGVREAWLPFAQLLRDGAVWIIPVLLPLSTLLYTFSDSATDAPISATQPGASLIADIPEQNAKELPHNNMIETSEKQDTITPGASLIADIPENIIATCAYCDWQAEYDNPTSAKMGKLAHEGRFCSQNPALSFDAQNGHHA